MNYIGFTALVILSVLYVLRRRSRLHKEDDSASSAMGGR
jgi:hypothetical protein